MQGLQSFSSLSEALNAGFEVYDLLPAGYLVRTRTAAGWALAIVRSKR